MNNSSTYQPYDYAAAGFNGFLSRRISAPNAVTLNGLSNDAPLQEVNFDQMTASGSLGDVISVNGIKLDGPNKRIAILDDLGTEVGWIGNIGD